MQIQNSVAKGYTESFKALFLLEFTRELIRNSKKDLFSEKFSEEEIKSKIRKIGQEEEKIKLPVKPARPEEAKEKRRETFEEVFRFSTPKSDFAMQRRQAPPAILRIPEPNLPRGFMQPFPEAREIDLGRLNALVKDPLVKVIECGGKDQQVIVDGAMGRKLTETILSKEEIDSIIGKFSEEAKIPVNAGIYRVVVGKLILSAIVSKVIGSKFIIKKMTLNTENIRNQLNQRR